MKYIVVLVDGMADEPIEELDFKTPLEVARIPTINQLAQKGKIGLVHTVPEQLSPGSDVANLSVMGYDPLVYHTGRSPLEAASIGVSLKNTDVTFRVNLVTLSDDDLYESKIMLDHSSEDISTEESSVLLKVIKESFESLDQTFHVGVSYRHLLLWHHGFLGFDLTPPHDILGRCIRDFLPKGEGVNFIAQMMEKSYALLKNHPINLARTARGLRPANAMWIWGEGKKPALDSYETKFGLSGSVISAVDLIKGIGILSGLKSIDVIGATGNLHTNFIGKAQACLKTLLDGDDFCYLHIEAPDECGHQGDLKGKIESIEKIDALVVKTIVEGLEKANVPFRMLIVPDHPTPIRLRTHTREPVPFVLYDSTLDFYDEKHLFTEHRARESGWVIDKGHMLIRELFEK